VCFVAPYAFMVAMLCYAFKYPSTPIIIALVQIPVALALSRAFLSATVKTEAYYTLVCRWCIGVACSLAFVWVVWIFADSWDGTNTWGESTKLRLGNDLQKVFSIHNVSYPECDYRVWKNLDEDSRKTIQSKCTNGNLTLYLNWASPMAAAISVGCLALFCRLRLMHLSDGDDPSSVQQRARSAVHMVLMVFALLVLTLWVAASIAGASMALSDTILGFTFAIFTVAGMWCMLTLDIAAILGDGSRFAKNVRSLSRNVGLQGAMIIPMFVPLLMFLALSAVVQAVRRLTGRTLGHSGLVTKPAQQCVQVLRGWAWGQVLPWVCKWATLYFVMSIGVAKATFIFLSWLNGELAAQSFGVVIGIFVVVGLGMFLIPVVPGIPVYVTAGIMLAARGQSDPSVGFWGGVVIGVIVGFAVKLLAVYCQQEIIGRFLGTSVAIRRTVGVDQVPTRAIEQILIQPGLSLAKVGVLCGGPDWPVSVLTGILRLPPLQMQLGTLPCIFLVMPAVLSGAFLLRASEQGAWGPLTGVMAMLVSISQSGAALYAVHSFQKVASENYDELAKPRPEHADVVALTQKMKLQEDTYKEITTWGNLPPIPQLLLGSAATILMVDCFAGAMFSSVCWLPFDLGPPELANTSKSKIDDPIERGGLGGDPLNIVRGPGWMVLGAFATGLVLWFFFVQWANRATAKRLSTNKVSPGQEADPEKQETK